MEVILGAGPSEVNRQSMSWTALWNADSLQPWNRGLGRKSGLPTHRQWQTGCLKDVGFLHNPANSAGGRNT